MSTPRSKYSSACWNLADADVGEAPLQVDPRARPVIRRRPAARERQHQVLRNVVVRTERAEDFVAAANRQSRAAHHLDHVDRPQLRQRHHAALADLVADIERALCRGVGFCETARRGLPLAYAPRHNRAGEVL